MIDRGRCIIHGIDGDTDRVGVACAFAIGDRVAKAVTAVVVAVRGVTIGTARGIGNRDHAMACRCADAIGQCIVIRIARGWQIAAINHIFMGADRTD